MINNQTLNILHSH